MIEVLLLFCLLFLKLKYILEYWIVFFLFNLRYEKFFDMVVLIEYRVFFFIMIGVLNKIL